jgi:hypothetical protein
MNDHIDGRNDAVLRVKVRKSQVVCVPHIADDHRLARPIRPSLWRCLVGLRDHPSDDPEVPATPGLDEKIVLSGTVSANLAERNIQGRRTDTGGFGEDRQQVGFVECEPSKLRQSRLLAAKFLYGWLDAMQAPLLFVGRAGVRVSLCHRMPRLGPCRRHLHVVRIPMMMPPLDEITEKASRDCGGVLELRSRRRGLLGTPRAAAVRCGKWATPPRGGPVDRR